MFGPAQTHPRASATNQNDTAHEPPTRTKYTHDDLARIATANCGTAANQTFSYDAFGNISKSGSPYAFQPTYNSATNRFATIPGTTPSYDANGSVLSDGSHTYTWDADGNSTTIDSVSLTYDALDRMVEQNRSSSYMQIVYGPSGGKLALMNGQTLQRAFIPLPGQAKAVYTSAGLDHYRHSDWLGSARLTSSPTQSTGFLSSLAYAPFGETYASSGATDPSFTGMNPDTTGNGASSDYDFLYRPYSTEGRWPTPDRAGLSASDQTNPQSWNRYAYVLNNPLVSVDPLGLDCIYMGGGNPFVVPGDCLSDNDNGVFVDGTVTSTSIDSNGDLKYGFTPDDCADGSLCTGTGTEADFANWGTKLNLVADNSSSIDWSWWKGLAASPLQWRLPSDGPGSCFAIFENTVKGPLKALKSVRDDAKDLIPVAAGAASGATNVSMELGDMLRKRQLDPFVGPAVVAGARTIAVGLNSLALGVVRAGPYVARGVLAAGDVLMAIGVGKETYAAWTGKCHP